VRAHPAGPRHGDAGNVSGHVSLGDLPERPADPTELGKLAASVWPTGADRGTDGAVRLAGVDVRELAAQYGTPLFVLDEDDFRSRCQEMAAAFGGAANVHYAAKAFLCGEIARWVSEEGLSLDVCSGGELAVALHAEFPANRIAMHGNNKSVTELTAAVQAGVGAVVIDSLQEIERLEQVARAHHTVQDVLIRVTVGVEAHTHEFIATAHEDQKFGFSLAGGDAAKAAAQVLNAANLRLVGLHSHIGSQIFDVDGFEVAAHRVVGLLRALTDTHGAAKLAHVTTLDLGGGMGISYLASDDPPPVDQLADKLRHIVRTECAAAGLADAVVAVEPGRAIVGPSTVTLYEVGTLKDVRLGAATEHRRNVRRYVSVDGGMSDNVRTALYDADYDCRLVSRASTAEPVVSRVVGKHCESGDIVVRDTWLPADLAAGDLIAVAATGAYCYSMSSRYNMLTRPAVVAVRAGAARLILRRETTADLISLEVS